MESRLSCGMTLDLRFTGPSWVSLGTVGEDRKAASLSLLTERRGEVGLDVLPTVLSTSVTSPMSESMVPLPYMMGVVGVIGPVEKPFWADK
jgi:hypothetical protein